MRKNRLTSRKENVANHHSNSKKTQKIDHRRQNILELNPKVPTLKMKPQRQRSKKINVNAQKDRSKPKQAKQTFHKTKSMSLSPCKNKKQRENSRKSKNKKESCKPVNLKRRNSSLINKVIHNQKEKQLCIQSTQFFFPLTYTADRSNDPNYLSGFLSNQSIQQDNNSRFSVPLSHQQVQKSCNLKQSHFISIDNWEEYETIKLKNEELTIYVEQLEKNEKKLINQKEEQQKIILEQHKNQKQRLENQLADLKVRQEKTNQDNVTLQEMFNDRQHCIQALKKQNQLFGKKIKVGVQREKSLQNEKKTIENDSNELKNELKTLKKNLQTLRQEKSQTERRYKECCSEKLNIKNYAEEMLLMIKKLKEKEQN